MADEHTPLIQVVRVSPQRERYSHSTLRRFCTIALGATLIVVVVLFMIPLRWLPGADGTPPHRGGHGHWSESALTDSSRWTTYKEETGDLPHRAWPLSSGIDYEELLSVLDTTPDPKQARKWSEYYTSGPHLAGRNLSQAVRTMQWWEEAGVSSSIVAYDVYINYPAGHGLKLMEKKKGSKKGEYNYETIFEATVEEDVIDEDPTTALQDRVPVFHGYSASGNVTGELVYCNFGTYQDFEDLVAAGVDLKGKIALAKYGGIFRGLKVKRAQELGMVGTVLYSDPQEDGDITEANGYAAYPDGPARNPSAVQRGSVQFLSFAPGDPTTPGYPSLPGVPRQDTKGAIPEIPSLPISYKEALPLLKALNGHGPKASEFGEKWQGGGLGHKGIEYHIGPSKAVVNLVNEQDYTITPLWDVIGIVNGTIPDEVVVVGNHRDAWIAGGAVDPNSGSAAINELIRGVGTALKRGWKPQRTIVFGSWDGEEYGLVGSTEWVEEYLPWLSGSAVAYINVDVGTGGPHFGASASPMLDDVLRKAVASVQSPNQTVKGQTVGDVWDGHISTMGSGSDFTAFQDFAGIPSLDMGFKADEHSAVYHYHSNYDSFHWMDRFGDANWEYHATIAKVWGRILADLVESPVLSLNASAYAVGLERYLDSVREHAQTSTSGDIEPEGGWFKRVLSAIKNLQETAKAFDEHAAHLRRRVAHGVPWWHLPRRLRLWRDVREVNNKAKFFERQFLYFKGLDERPWFKHVVFAPGLWTGYAGATFPGLVESIDRGDKEGIERWSGIITHNVENAAAELKLA